MNIRQNLSWFVLLSTATLLMCGGLNAQLRDLPTAAKPDVHTEYFAHPDDAKKKIGDIFAAGLKGIKKIAVENSPPDE